jgi:hypothetical protein
VNDVEKTRMAVLVVALCAVECDSEQDDLPAGWELALSLPVDQSSCGGTSVMSSTGTLVLMRDMGRLRATYQGAQFRCEQRLCAFRLEETGGTRVLVQPCEMNPATVTRCDCLYAVGFDLPAVETGRTVELHRRWDRYGATAEPVPVLVDTEKAP